MLSGSRESCRSDFAALRLDSVTVFSWGAAPGCHISRRRRWKMARRRGCCDRAWQQSKDVLEESVGKSFFATMYGHLEP